VRENRPRRQTTGGGGGRLGRPFGGFGFDKLLFLACGFLRGFLAAFHHRFILLWHGA